MRLPLIAATAALALALWIPATAGAATFNVTKTADTNDGSCDPADCSLREAIIAANGSAGADTVNLPAGHYTLTIAGAGEDLGVTGDLDMTESLTINGAGASQTTVDANNGDRAFDIFNTGTAVTISGVTITNGSQQLGSAIRGDGSSLSLSGVTISGNTAGGVGLTGDGAVHFVPAGPGSMTITNSTFSGNKVGGGAPAGTGQGGGIYFRSTGNGTLTVIGSTFSNNTVGGTGSTGEGGGIFFQPAGTGDATVTDSTFSGNKVGLGATGVGFGGGISHFSDGNGTLTVTNSSFTDNTLGGAGFGGGISFRPGGTGSVNVTGSTFSGNRVGGGGGAGSGGGIFHNSNDSGTLTVTGSTFSNNTVGGNGGGGNGGGVLFTPGAASSSMNFTNDTISNNTAGGGSASGLGGGLSFDPAGTGSTAALTNTTIADNSAAGAGGIGGGALVGTGENAPLKNTIVANNTASTGANCNGPINSQGHNLESADTCTFNAAGDLKNTDPKLDPLADNGGPTLTRALQKGSPAIDAGDNSGCPATDQRGGSRPQPPSGACDIGAFEFGALADLAIAKTVSPDPVSAGKDLTYALTVTNNGPDEAAGIRVDEPLAADTTFGSASASQGSCSGSGPVTCSIGTLAKGTTATATITVKPAKAGTTTNTATVSGNPTDTNPANNTATASATVKPTIKSLKIKPRKFRAARRGGSIAARTGARVTYSLYEAASVRFTVERALAGRKVGKSCKAPTHKNRKRKRCTRYKKVKGSFKRTGKAGKQNRFTFTGRLARKRLRPGKYRLVGVATASGIDSDAKRAQFTIVR